MPRHCGVQHKLTGVICSKPAYHSGDHADSAGQEFRMFEKPSDLYFCIYGDAYIIETGTRLEPKRWPGQYYPENCFFVIDTVKFDGVAVVGVVLYDGAIEGVMTEAPMEGRYEMVNVSFNPDPEPPGNWGARIVGHFPARWVHDGRKSTWDRLSGVEDEL
jgi:hypothetical protein